MNVSTSGAVISFFTGITTEIFYWCGFLTVYVSTSNGADGNHNREIEISRAQLADLGCAALKVIFNEWFIWVKSLLQHQDTFYFWERTVPYYAH